jgi:hypothetical protein
VGISKEKCEIVKKCRFWFRRPMLYPVELRAQRPILYAKAGKLATGKTGWFTA